MTRLMIPDAFLHGYLIGEQVNHNKYVRIRFIFINAIGCRIENLFRQMFFGCLSQIK